MPKPKLTPMFEQYLRIKEEYPDTLLFYRMGDFYEVFFEDAEVAARELSITLTSRSSPKSENRVPMAGVPHHSVNGYLSQLLEKGFRVAICDQIEDPKQAKGLVKRAVTRVLTPGTVLDDANLESKGQNFLGAMLWNSTTGSGGLAWVDVSTGEWSGIQAKQENTLWQWVQKMSPRELLLVEGAKPPALLADLPAQVLNLPLRSHFSLARSRERIMAAQSVADLQVLDLADKPELTQACGALLAYLEETQLQEIRHLGQFKPLVLTRHLLLDEVTERNLELFQRLDGRKGAGTLWQVMDKTLTPMGGRLLKERMRHPWRDMAPIRETQDAVEYFFKRDSLRAALRESLKEVYDLERLSTRIFMGRAQPKDFIALRQSLGSLPNLQAALVDRSDGPLPRLLNKVLQNWDNLAEYRERLDRALVDSPPPVITEGGLFKQGYDPQLDELMELTEHGESTLTDLLAREQAKSGLPKLKLGHNRVFGHYFELPKSQSEDVPEHFVRRQTLANSERFTTPRLKELEDKLVSASDKRKNLEYSLFQELRAHVAEARPRFLFMADMLAGLDHWQGLAEAARQWDWTRPELSMDQGLLITQGRHPVVEAVQGASNFIPNDLALDDQRKILLITGPNMAGKSTVLRQAALICIMAQMGSFVPAKQAQVGLADRVFSRVGASDNLAQGRSTFMVEMAETARILRQATKKSLVILDEVGRGTSTFDGLALAWAVVEELARRSDGIRTLFATHYHELTVLEGRVDGVRNMNIAVKEWGGDIVFLRRLVPGPADRSYGIEVARLAGVPQPVVGRARDILTELEKKARDAESRLELKRAAQTLLPGMEPRESRSADKPTRAKTDPRASALLKALHELDPERLTPMDALNLVHHWKTRWGTEDADE